MSTIYEQALKVMTQIRELTDPKMGNLMVIGCSSSTVLGGQPGTNSSRDVAEQLHQAAMEVFGEKYDIAVQCCEHLNRALIVERKVAERYGLTMVNAVPYEKAGGAFATVHYASLTDPVAVEDIHSLAVLGIDIGGVMVGMHLRPVVVPLKLKERKIGEAIVIAGASRLKYIGGERTHYQAK